MQKLWANSLHAELNQEVNDFNSSIRFDSRMFAEDIVGSLIHADGLAKQGIISEEDVLAIRRGLLEIQAELASGALPIDPAAEDIHSFIEAELTARIGEAGKRLHTARSRNDQVATDLRLYLRNQAGDIYAGLHHLVSALVDKAEAEADTILPGYTHLQRAQPISLGLHLLAYSQMFLRDISRLLDWRARMNYSPLGSAALAGTPYDIDRFFTAEGLGFIAPTANALDGVSDRDFVLELAFVNATIMTHISRLAEEIILWCSWEFRFARLDDAYSTGSSIMPQKKNPDIAELARGKAGRAYGDLMALLTVMKGLPLAYNKDMQEDKEAIFDSVDTVISCLSMMTPMLATLSFNRDKMRQAAAEGFINATDCADYLVSQGLPFRDAYRITGDLVAQCIEQGQTLETLPLAAYQQASPLFGEEVYGAIDLDRSAGQRASYGGAAPAAVRVQIAEIRELLSKWE